MNKNKTSLIIIISAIILIAVLVSLYFFKKDKKLELESNYVSGDQQATPQSNIELARLKAEAETQKLNDLIAQSESLKFSNSNATTSNNFLSNANSYINDPTNGLVDAPTGYKKVIKNIVNKITNSNSNNNSGNVTGVIITPIELQQQIENQTIIVAQANQELANAEAGLNISVSSNENINTDQALNQTQNQVPAESVLPSVLLTNPKAGSILSYIITVSASATDNAGIAKVEFYNNTALIGSDTAFPYTISWNTADVFDGIYNMTAKAYDTSGNTKTSKSVSVIISNSSNPLDNVHYSEDPELIEGANKIDE